MLASSSSSSPSLSAASGNQYLKEPNTLSSRSRANTSSPRPRNKIQQQHQESSPQFRPSSPSTINTVGTSTTSSSTSYNNNSAASPNVSSKAPTTDAGTQYTPPDWPPTSTRSSLYTSTYNIDSSAAAVTLPINEPPSTITASPHNFDTTRPTTTVTVPPTQSQPQTLAPAATPSAPSPPPQPPAEPILRVTPRITLQQNATPVPATATTAIRRHHKAISETPPGTPTTSKRSKAQNPDVKVLPKDYWLCDAKILAGIIADMLMELIRFNDEIPLGNGHLTRFHSRAPPGISVHDYLARLTYHATLSPPILLSMVYYIDKLCALYPSFTINSLTVHRFLITSATVASKGLSDSFWTNNTYARVGGVSLKELALLEIELLQRVQWRIVPSPEGLEDYYGNLVGRSEGFVVEGQDKEEQGEEMNMNTEKNSDGADEDEDMDGKEEKGKESGVGEDVGTRLREMERPGASSSTTRDAMDTSTSSTSDESG